MTTRRILVPAAILIGAFVAGTAFGTRRVPTASAAEAPTPSREELGLPSFQPQEAKIDREQFRLSATSLARPDLLACRNLDAKPREPAAVTPAEFARALNGVWLATARSVHGIPVEMDTAFYIQLTEQGGQAVLIDRNNLRKGVFSRALQRTRARSRAARRLTMTFVNCRYEFIDQYVKVSDTVPVETLLAATATPLRRRAGAPLTLEQAWRAMVDTGYFGRRSDIGPKARLGDRTRIAILPSGVRTTEGDIEKGITPAAEYQLPMVVGGLFRTKLEETKGENGFPSVRMSIDAEYAGSGVNVTPDEITKGTERGTFMREGDALVSYGKEAYMTSSCGDKNGLTEPGMLFERLVISGM